MVAGEASGDLLAGLLLDGVKLQWPDAAACGIGGPHMARHGFEAWWPHHKLAVHGFSWELVRRYREIVGIRDQLQQRFMADPPDVFIGVDAPDFNLDLENSLRSKGIKTMHFVCPSIWAWRPQRIEKIRRSVNHVLCIFPFEVALLASRGIRATYVGHPLASHIPLKPDRAAARAALGLGAEDRVVALLPGSRSSEIRHLARRFFHAAKLIRQAQPGTRFIVPCVPGLLPLVAHCARQAGWNVPAFLGQEGNHDAAGPGAPLALELLNGQSHLALAACDVTLIASGTATLEAALFKRPMVIAYHMGWVSWQLMRRKRLQPWVGLPNILCGDFVVPELLQDAATPEALAGEVVSWLQDIARDAQRTTQIQSTFTALHHTLQRDTAQLAVHAIQEVLQS